MHENHDKDIYLYVESELKSKAKKNPPSITQDFTEMILQWPVTELKCDGPELWLYWTVCAPNCDCSELWLFCFGTWLNTNSLCRNIKLPNFTELLLYWLYWPVTQLNYDCTELLREVLSLDRTVAWFNCDVPELLLYWTVHLLNCYLSELLLDWSVAWLNCYVTALFR